MNNSAIMATAALGGLLSATLSVLHIFPIPGLVFFSYFATLPLFLVGLSLGLRPLYVAGLLASAIVLLLQGPFIAGEFLVFSFLGPAFLMYRALLNRKKKSGEVSWYPSSLLLRDITYAAGFVMIIAVAAYFYFTNGEDAGVILKPLLKSFDPKGHLKDAEPLLLRIFPFLPGFFAVSWSVMIFLNAILAQGLLVRFNRNLRPTPSFTHLSVPKSFLIIFGVAFILSFIGLGALEVIGKNTAFVLTLPFFLVGLSLIHSWMHKSPYPTAGLTVFYFLLLLLFWPVLFVILIGILKPWIEKTFPAN
jgi:uncharacterized protein YybS (DUF2232 family)